MPAPCLAPSALVYQLASFTLGTTDFLILPRMEYDGSFIRVVRWVTVQHQYADQVFETMPQASIKITEFQIVLTQLSPNNAIAIETFFDAHQGSVIPFKFTAPDDAVPYGVRFKDDSLQTTTTSAATRDMSFSLIEVGDLLNVNNNDTVYPAYVQPDATFLGQDVTGGGGAQTVLVNNTTRLTNGSTIIVGYQTLTQETVTVISHVGGSSPSITAVFAQNHLRFEQIVFDI